MILQATNEMFNYGVIGNCRTAALVSDQGSIDWLCLPDFDSGSVFASILDKEKGGHFSIHPEGYSISQRYITNTNILCTSFVSEDAAFDLIDFMPRYRIGESNTHYLPAEVCRYFKIRKGRPRFRPSFVPAMNYARNKASFIVNDDYIKIFAEDNLYDTFYLYSSFDLNSVLNGDEIELVEDGFFVISYNQKLVKIDIDRVNLEYQRTKVYWINWSNRTVRFTLYNTQIQRSVLVLKLMSYQSSGAVLAALTTSLPEALGEVRNWDYRFCWLRDASMSIDTLLEVGHQGAAQRFMSFIKTIVRKKSDNFQIMYGIRGERTLTEEILDHLSGHENSRPVRIGNDAYHQKQNDSFGYLMDVIYQYYRFFPGTLDEIEDMYEVVKNIVRSVSRDWREPDKGIWEIRGAEQHFVFSKVMSWVALDRAVSIATLLQKHDIAERWKLIADEIKEDVMANGWNADLQSFTQTYSNTEMDSSLLLMEEYGFLEANDERYIKTVDAVYKSLFNNGLMYRYTTEDDFGKPTSAFTICTFWMVRALYVVGRQNEAQQIFNNLLSYSNHLGLFSEDLDFKTKRQLGNFPQAYSHLALINTAKLFAERFHLSPFIRP
ncbi:MAG: glycoside hydrolase family 15 protein [Paludibacteraceae bacterium]|nr:glycoside hydrolase family 15 protein [Paludibacteraceae bacterium]